MASLGVSREVVGHVLNHAEGLVSAVYDLHSYDAENIKALRCWEEELRRIIA